MEVNEKSASVRIHALGELEVTAGAILRYRSRVRARKVQELLMGLVSAGAHGLAGHMLCEALWPESGGDEAYRALAATVYRLRRTLHCRDAVLFAGGRVALSVARCWVDAWVFEQAVRESVNLDGAAVMGKLLSALPLYRGPLFGVAESPLALEARDRLGRAYARATLAVGESLLRAGDVPGAIHLYEHSLGLDDSREELYRALILVQANIGDTLAATQTYQRCRYSLRNRFGTAPSLATVRAWHESCRPHAGSGEGGTRSPRTQPRREIGDSNHRCIGVSHESVQ